MKKIIHILLLLLLYPWVLRAQTTKVISLTYHADDFNYTTENGLLHIGSTKYDYYFESDTLKPALPILSVSLLIGPFQTYSSYMQTKTEVLVRDNVTLNANPLPITTDMDISRLPIPSASYSKGIYPAQNIEYAGTQIVDGYQILSFKVCPFKYNAATKKLYLNTHINITVSLGSMTGEKLTKARARQNTAQGLSCYEMMHDLVVNADELESLYGTYSQIKSRYPATNERYDYLIVTRDSLKSSFQPLADWKTMKGIPTKILTMEEIEARLDYDASNPQLSIKKAIKEYKDNGLQYLLLGGKANIVPVKKNLCQDVVWSLEKNRFETIIVEMPTDLYYSSFEQLDWGNGSPIAVSNVSPDITCTRVSIKNAQTARTVVQRFIAYEKGEMQDSWTNKVLMGGARIYLEAGNGYFVMGGDTLSDAHYYGEIMYNNHIAPYMNADRFRFYDTGTDSLSGRFYDFCVENIQQELSSGYLIADISTHGGINRWWTEMPSSFSMPEAIDYGSYHVRDAKSLINSGNTFIVTTACHTNAFDTTKTCLSEAFMCNPNGGILGYLGCSRQAIIIMGSSLGGSLLFDSYFYDKLLSGKEKRLGVAVKNAKLKWTTMYQSQIRQNSTERWLLFGINLLGDPEMPLFTEYPKSFSNISISYTDSTLSVNAGLDSCRICVMSSNDVGNTYYHIEDIVSNATFTIPVNTYSVCVTKSGYIPYRAIVCNGNYIQNESFDCDTYVYSGQLSIGSDVSTAKPKGPVIVESGKMKINATNSVYIKNNFEVKPGAALSIE